MKEVSYFVVDCDEETMCQFEECFKCEFVVKAALMPDAHKGYVAPIGSVLVSKDYIVPSWVGYDIGCGVLAVKLSSKNSGLSLLDLVQFNKKGIFEFIRGIIPMGKGVYSSSDDTKSNYEDKVFSIIERFGLENFNMNDINLFRSKFLFENLLSLGSGNHFIELGSDGSDLFVVVHSGSRKIGHNFAKKYMKLAQRESLYNCYKDSGEKKEFGFEATFPILLKSKLGREYFTGMGFCVEFAKLNRFAIVERVVSLMSNFLKVSIELEVIGDSVHNFAEVSSDGLIIHRKGATEAKKDQICVIPGNLRDGTFIMRGLGNDKFICSSSHGAGRVLSRKEAKKVLRLSDVKRRLEEVGVLNNISESNIDEADVAYKNIYSVLDLQKESVSLIKQIKPIINWKG